jgi:hypothetical protein
LLEAIKDVVVQKVTVFYLLSFAGWIVINNFFVLFTTKEVNSSSTTGVHSRKKMYRTTTTVLNSWDLCPTEIYTLLLCRQWNRKGIIGCSSNGYRFLISCTVNKHNSVTSAPQRQFSHFLLIPLVANYYLDFPTPSI